jgi:hypothetical protein
MAMDEERGTIDASPSYGEALERVMGRGRSTAPAKGGGGPGAQWSSGMSISSALGQFSPLNGKLETLAQRGRSINERLIGSQPTDAAPTNEVPVPSALRDEVRYWLERLTRVTESLEAELKAIEAALWSK